jgi:hypothetical protein
VSGNPITIYLILLLQITLVLISVITAYILMEGRTDSLP